MRKFLYDCVGMISRIHDKIMQLNNAYEANLSDKELHFLVIGLLGLAMTGGFCGAGHSVGRLCRRRQHQHTEQACQ